ncbi:hypothetical protein J4206_07030 [Candidatus Woesearchaeota archaeon]|nr:hypothetical protein [Candidatus Woesearchaeota archaeon]
MPNAAAMKLSIDTKEDSHDDIKKVIRMLQNIVGDSQEIFTNHPENQENVASPIANIFGDASTPSEAPETTPEAAQQAQETAEGTPQSTDDLFAELFSEEELKKMDVKNESEEEEESEEEIKSKPKDKKYGIEFY